MNIFKKIKNWEQWPFKLLYAPLAPIWLYYILRSRAVWFFTPSNPKLTFGGMEGEPKKEMHDLLPLNLCPVYFNVRPGTSLSEILATLREKRMNFPVIAKPEIGGQGILVRKIANEEELKFYHEHVPYEYFLQDFVTYSMEVSLFYYRYPWENTGHITGFLHKVPLRVIGDGVRTLYELIVADEKSKKQLDVLQVRYKSHFNNIIPEGEVFKLSDAGNHNRGARFIDLKDEIDNNLVALLDKISNSIDDFFYGRYDIMCESIADLKAGRNFVILEYNGCGAEPNHFYDTGYTLRKAYLEIIMHWKKLFTISRYNYKQGCEYWPFLKGWRFLSQTKKYFKSARILDQQIP